jgi:catechol 2,3-dioxygenase-like lactoylglutathione lyase family enzyme
VTATPATPIVGVHHVRLPVRDLERSFAFWHQLLGYERDFDFLGSDGPLGWALRHPAGGPDLVLWHDPELAAATAGFPWFSMALPSADDVRALCAELDRRGIAHGGIRSALVDVKLPFVQDPDGHLVGFYVSGPRRPAPALH